MKNIVFCLCMFTLLSCETKYGYIDTGLANGKFDGDMYEYLHSSSYDWDSTLVLVNRAGVQDLFRGKEAGYEKITFFGPTNLSILRWMIQKGYNSLNEVPVDSCRKLIMKHVVAGEYMRDDIPRGAVVIGKTQGEGGVVLKNAWGTQFWVYSYQEPYKDIPETGPVVLYVRSLDTSKSIDVASTNIETDSGVVHSLDYYYTLGEL